MSHYSRGTEGEVGFAIQDNFYVSLDQIPRFQGYSQNYRLERQDSMICNPVPFEQWRVFWRDWYLSNTTYSQVYIASTTDAAD